jgi:ABC-2 type transport system permease protein
MYRFVLRRDRIRLFVWAGAIAALILTSAAAVENSYSDPEQLAFYASQAQDKAVFIIQAGPGYGLDDPTTGAVLMNETSIWTLILVSIMSILMVTRHTRAEEESERAELLRATPIGRDAGPVGAMLGVLTAVVLAAVGAAAGLFAFGYDVTGTVAFALTIVGTGMVFAGVSLVMGQVAASSRAGTGLALAVLAGSFVLRAVGDVGNGVLSWFSPIGWGQAIRAFADERWWVLGVQLVATVSLVVVAAVLSGHRDIGAGMMPQRAGAAEAGPMLSSTMELSVRLQRATVAAWVVGVAVLGAFYGVVTDAVEEMISEQPELADFMAQAGVASITDSFLATAAMMMGLLGAGYAVSAVLRMHTEESAGRVDPLLATPTARTRWAGGHLAVAAAASVLVLLAGGLGVGVGAAIVTGEWSRVLQMVGAVLVIVPAVAVLAGVAFLLCAAAPRWALVSWVGVVVAVVVGLFGEVLNLPGWARGLSPLYHVPAIPAADLDLLPLLVLGGIAAALVALGLAGISRRDMSST